MAKSAVKSIFSLHPLPVISSPKPPFFVRSSHFWGKNHLFRGVFLFSSREILARKLILHRQKQFDGEFFGQSTRNSTLAGVEKEKVGVFSSNHRRSNIKTRKVLPKYKHKDEKHKAITKKPMDKIKKQTYYTEKTKHKQAREIVFLSLPHSVQKYMPTFSQNFSTFRDFLPCFSQNLPTPHKTPFTLRAGHAPTRIYALALSANLPFLPSPFTLPRNKL